MTYKISISDETAESMFRDMLIEDYRRVRNDIYDMTNKAAEFGNLEKYEYEDLEDWKRWFAAMKILMEYYLPQNQYNQVVGE